MSSPDIKLVSGSSHPELSRSISENLNIPLAEVNIKRFACNEIYVQLQESVRGKEVYIIQSCSSVVNRDYMELFLLSNACKMSFARKVHVILPHFGYSRQDRIAEPREALSAKLIADLLITSGVDHIVTFNLHSAQLQGFFNIPVDNINTKKLFVNYFKKKDIENAVVISPDVGGAKNAKKFADALNLPLAILHKVRPEHNKSQVTHVVGDIKGKVPIIYDDIIDTAGTVVAAKQALIDNGSDPDVYLVATHGIFSDPAVERLQKAQFKEVVVTDTVPLENKNFDGLNVISIAPFAADIIRNVSDEKSVTKLYT